MKKLVFTTIVCIISLNCLGQKKDTIIKTTKSANGEQVNYITENTFKNMSINGILKLDTIREPNSINKVIRKLGKPIDLKHEKDHAVDGSVIFERKIVKYSGLRLTYPLHDNFVVSKIEITSKNYFLCINGIKVQVDMPIKKITDFLSDQNGLKKNGLLNIDVAESKQKLKNDEASSVSIGFKNLNIEYDPSTEKITKISISIRYT